MCGSIVDIQFATAEIRPGEILFVDGTYVRMSCGVFYPLFFSSPNLSGRKLDVYYTSTHGLVGVCSVCVTCRRGVLSRHEQLVRYLLMCPVKAWLTFWLDWLELMQRQPTSASAALATADAYAALPEATHIFLLGPCRHRRHLDVAN